ncbi:MAG: T9SS type A sorting domain-containing protein, partial [Bacteroidales bacterium]|nr:T9SS type A sorting domain-containing protein [Bacteroidales bacterium]
SRDTGSDPTCVSSAVFVIDAVPSAPEVSVVGLINILVGGTTTLSPTTGGTWASNNPLVASVSNAGLVTGLSVGSSTFTFTSSTTGCSNTTEPVTVVELPASFVPVWWPGNGMDHMNFYALTATLDDVALQPGDAIGIFDGPICVGVGILQEILTGLNYLSIIVSHDDSDTPETDGFITGHIATFRVWDQSEDSITVYADAVFEFGDSILAPGATSSFNLTAVNPLSQTITLKEGWNILSFTTTPDNPSMLDIVNPLITAGTLLKVQDEAGDAIVQLPVLGWVNGIGDFQITEGYNIKVSEDTQLSIIGRPIDSPLDIPLLSGWNIFGYPFPSGQAAETALEPLISEGSLIKVQNEIGQAIVELPLPLGWVYGFSNLLPGEGYKIKVNIPTTLTLSNNDGGILKSSHTVNQLSHFRPVYKGNGLDHMNLYIMSPTLGQTDLTPGDEIGVFDGDVCVGAAVVDYSNPDYVSVAASLDDPTTEEIDGFVEGHSFTLRLWDHHLGKELIARSFTLEPGSFGTFTKNGTSVLKTDFEDFKNDMLSNAYPNPSYQKTIFNFILGNRSNVRLEIINSIGTIVAILVDDELNEGPHSIEWNNRSATGLKMEPGVYYYRMITNGSTQTKSLVIR